MYSVKRLVSLFTDYFRKDEESNTYKLMQLFSDELELLRETNEKIIAWRDIDQAEGKALDLIGQNVVQPRGDANDEKYRILLKTKVSKNLADGTINSFIRSVAYALNVPESEIRVLEMWEDGFPATLAIDVIPLDRIVSAGFSNLEFEELLTSLIAAGVQLVRLARFKTTIHFATVMTTGESLSITPPIKTKLNTTNVPRVAMTSMTGECITLFPYIAETMPLHQMNAFALVQTYGETLTIFPQGGLYE